MGGALHLRRDHEAPAGMRLRRARIARWLAVIGGFAVALLPAGSQTAPAAEGVTALTFAYIPRDPGQPPWEIDVPATGNGSYRVQGSEAAAQPLHVGEATWRRLHGGDATIRSGRCESKLKNIAQNGVKTISLGLKDGVANCTFNYSDDAALNEAATAFLALSETMRFGDRLQREHRFDRLALDSEVEALDAAVKEGRVLEVENIAAVLLSVVNDDRVIDRARRKAARLLQDAGVPVPAGSESAR